MKENEASIQGTVIREMIAHFTAESPVGHKIKSGELRKKMVEPKWICPSAYTMTEIDMDLFTMEWLESEEDRDDFVILQLHGGGYVGAMRNAYRNFAVLYHELSEGMKVLTIDYRVAPENPYPAALEDAAAAYDWLLLKGYTEKQIIIVGDSAGGGLAMSLCMYLKDRNRELPAGIIAMSPWTDMTASGSSYEENFKRDPLFGRSSNSMIYNRDYLGLEDPENPYLSPLFGDFHDFPPMLIQVGSYEMLRDDSILVAEKAKKSGVKVRLTVYEGMFHIFQMCMKLIPESRRAWAEIKRFIDVVAVKNEI